MGPKKGSKSKSVATSSSVFDKKKFVNEFAAELYEEWRETKTLIPERGLQLPKNQSRGDILLQIQRRQWEKFTEQPEPAVVPVVYEFYANAAKSKALVSIVRGKKVAYDWKSINVFYGIQNELEDDVGDFAGPHDFDQIMHDLCAPGTQWTISKKDPSTPNSFPTSQLSRFGKAWFYFICGKLLPTTHVSCVNKDRAILLHILVNDGRINVGNMIEDNISIAVEGRRGENLPHPSLITALCRKAGVPIDNSEEKKNPLAVIDHRSIDNYKQPLGEPNKSGAGFQLVSPQTSPATVPQHSVPSTSATEPISMELIYSELMRQNRRINRHIDRAEIFMSYAIEYNQAMECFVRGDQSQQFPLPPVLPPFSPSAANEESDPSGS